MNIESIDNKEFIELWVEGELWKVVHKRLYRNYLQRIFQCQSKKELQDLLLMTDIKIGRRIAYKLLSIRGYLKSELRIKLKKYQIASEAIEKLFIECEKLGYLDDQREGKLFIARKKRQGMGPQMIAYKLEQRAPELKEMVQESVSDEEQRKAIREWVMKKTKNKEMHEMKVKQRLYRFLRGKGFDTHLIHQELEGFSIPK